MMRIDLVTECSLETEDYPFNPDEQGPLVFLTRRVYSQLIGDSETTENDSRSGRIEKPGTHLFPHFTDEEFIGCLTAIGRMAVQKINPGW